MRVGVTGSTGLIGRALVKALQARGDEVVTFVRPGSHSTSTRAVAWDPAAGTLSSAELDSAGPLDAVIHLAGAGIGERRWSAARKREILVSRVRSTATLVASLSQRATKPFLLSASAVGYYGPRGDETLDETSPRGRGFLSDVCVAWEDEATRYTKAGGVVALARTGIVLDRRGGALAKQLALFRLGLGGRLGSGRQWLSPISLRDEVAALLWILDHRLEGPVNLTGPDPVTNRRFTGALAKSLRRPAFFAVPAFALSIVLGREGAKELVLTSQRVLPKVLTDSGFVFSDPDIDTEIASALEEH
ncbi:MAG TPA: TIGR01777 family oxidoreductase [Acidimicrobiales bacterium]|nr:TIGR01777 family oxidoreductase [Acidimicrobiales bacterium]